MSDYGLFGPRCKRCHRLDANDETFPWCVRCAYCAARKHILQVLPNGKLPIHCHICTPALYLNECRGFQGEEGPEQPQLQVLSSSPEKLQKDPE